LDAIISDGAFTGQNPLYEGRALVGITGHTGQEGLWYTADELTGAIKSSSTEREGYHRMPADGVYVMSVDAERAKGVLRVGDVILSVNGLFVYSTSDLLNIVNLCRVGQRVSLGVFRDGAAITVELTLSEG
jgi:S1-C subfamily serine protease